MESSLLAVLGVVGVAASVVGLIAGRLRVPQVLLYLLLGALAGPSLLNIVNPDDLGEFFTVTLEVLVALIVFEGAFSIDARGLRRAGLVVRNLLTVGVTVTSCSRRCSRGCSAWCRGGRRSSSERWSR